MLDCFVSEKPSSNVSKRILPLSHGVPRGDDQCVVSVNSPADPQRLAVAGCSGRPKAPGGYVRQRTELLILLGYPLKPESRVLQDEDSAGSAGTLSAPAALFLGERLSNALRRGPAYEQPPWEERL